ncbi:hypothetical protein P8452_31995 [Trifolium repens]|nr:hypothetical protein P8452_31995 [Trifolium repens]
MGCYHNVVVVIVFIVAIKIVVAITVVVVVAVTVGSYHPDRVAGEGVWDFHGALQEKRCAMFNGDAMLDKI